MVVLLDNIRSLHNVGSIFRTADGAGVSRLYLCGITPSPLNRFKEVVPEIAKTALGAERAVAWEKCETTLVAIKKLKKEGYRIIALEQDVKAIPYTALLLTSAELAKTALVLGEEVRGLSKALLAKCDTMIEIPMRGTKESLNVSVAFGIAAFHLICHGTQGVILSKTKNLKG